MVQSFPWHGGMRYGPSSSWERHHDEAVRRAIQHSQESLWTLSKRFGSKLKTVAKWKGRNTVADQPTGLREARSAVLSVEEEAIIVAFRRHTLLPLDDCLYALQPTIPSLGRMRVTPHATRWQISENLHARPYPARFIGPDRNPSRPREAAKECK
jgi:hypothetical protein